MSSFPNWPHPERFRTYEDACAYLQNPNWRLCIPAFVLEDGKQKINPEYANAPFENSIFWQSVGPIT